MIYSTPVLDALLIGRLSRDTVIPLSGDPVIDVAGGSLLYAAAGLALWEKTGGLIARAGEDYPLIWLDKFSQRGFDIRGIKTIPESIDIRAFYAYTSPDEVSRDNPVAHFSKLNMSVPRSLIGYSNPPNQIDSRTVLSPLSPRIGDFPSDYIDATAAHICPLDYLSHTMLPSLLRQGHVTTITVDLPAGTMDPMYWSEIPAILQNSTALITTETKLRKLFEGRTSDLWEMAEAVGSYGCEYVVIQCGSRGQYLYLPANKSRWSIPAYASRWVDPTGMEDAFAGGALVGYKRNYDPLEAVLYGNVSQSLVVEGLTPFYVLDVMPGLASARLESQRMQVRKL